MAAEVGSGRRKWGRKVGIMAVDVTTDPGPVVGEEGCHGYIQLQ